jgi:hypothetical protein
MVASGDDAAVHQGTVLLLLLLALNCGACLSWLLAAEQPLLFFLQS